MDRGSITLSPRRNPPAIRFSFPSGIAGEHLRSLQGKKAYFFPGICQNENEEPNLTGRPSVKASWMTPPFIPPHWGSQLHSALSCRSWHGRPDRSALFSPGSAVGDERS